MPNKKITHVWIDFKEVGISTVSTDRLKEEIEWMKNKKEYAYKGERIVENLYVKGMLRDTPTYKALVKELEKRKRKELNTHFRGAFVCGKIVRYGN